MSYDTPHEILENTLRENEYLQEQLDYLMEMGNLLGHLDLQVLLVKVLELTTELLGAEVSSISLVDAEGEFGTAVELGLLQEALMAMKTRQGERVIDVARRANLPQLFTEEELQPILDGQYRAERLIILPLRTDSQFLGTINLVAPQSHATSNADLQAVVPGVGLAAIAIENAQLVTMKIENERDQEQLRFARQIQQSLLPRKPLEVPGLELAGASIPAKMICGDYYDYVKLPNGAIGLVVADVVGKGVPAGMVMTAVRAMLRSATRRLSSPAEILKRVNRQLCDEDLDTIFVTVLFASFDPQSGVLVTCSAGHDPMVLLREEGAVACGKEHSLPPLGILPEMEYLEEHFQLQPYDAFVFYTDGVTEATDQHDHQFGLHRLLAVVENGRHEVAGDLMKHVLGSIDAFMGTVPRHDDVTMLVGRWLGQPAELPAHVIAR